MPDSSGEQNEIPNPLHAPSPLCGVWGFVEIDHDYEVEDRKNELAVHYLVTPVALSVTSLCGGDGNAGLNNPHVHHVDKGG